MEIAKQMMLGNHGAITESLQKTHQQQSDNYQA